MGSSEQRQPVLSLRGMVLAGVFVGLVLLAVGWWQREPLQRWAAGEIDLRGQRIYLPIQAPEPERLAALDLARVHAELLPAWVMASAHHSRDAPTQLAALKDALAGEPDLLALLDRLVVLQRDPASQPERLFWVGWAWNTYLDRGAQPWRLSLAIRDTPRGSWFYTKSYHTEVDSSTQVGARSVRTRLLRRVDHTNVVEGYLGTASSHDQGALVLLDRVEEMALRRIWPLLDSQLDEHLDPVQRAFAPALRQLLREQLGVEAFALLADTAGDRANMLRLVEKVHARHDCGSRFIIPTLPWDGLSADDLDTLQRFAAAEQGAPCPGVRYDEAVGLRLASRSLRARPAGPLREAVEALVGLAVRPVVVHEARHGADPHEISCRGCGLTRQGALELSAYLASFADEDLGLWALYQACTVPQEGAGANGAALDLLLPRVFPEGCASSPPTSGELAERALALERSLLGRSDVITLAGDLPLRFGLADGSQP